MSFISKKENLYLFLVILYSGMAIPLFRSQEGLIFLWLLGLMIFYKTPKTINKNLLIALGIWTGYFVINSLIIQSFHPFFYGTYIAKIMIAYWLINHYKSTLFRKYEDIVYRLAILSLFFYTIQFFAPHLVFNIFESINMSGDLFSHIPYSSIGVYTFHQREMFEAFPRNSGFTWEPGPFSSYIALAVFFNIARNGVSFKNKKRLLIFLLAIITTQSTTGFLLLLAILLWYAWAHYNNSFFRLVSIPLTIGLIIYLFSTIPFLQEKIIEQAQQDVEDVISHAEVTGESYSPGRFAGIQLRWEDFKNYPIAGYGGNPSLQYGYIGEGNVVSAINGLGTILGRYGAIGSILFILLLLNSGNRLSNWYHFTGWFIYPSLMLIIGFSFGIIETPIIVTLWMIPLFLNIKYFKQ